MSTLREEHRAFYQSYLQHCNEHDLDQMASFHTPTIKVNGVTMDTPAALAQFTPVFSAFPDWHWDVRNIVIDGADIAVRFTVTGTHRRVFQGIQPTGRQVTITQFTFYRLEQGKIVEVWDHADMDALMRQISQGEDRR